MRMQHRGPPRAALRALVREKNTQRLRVWGLDFGGLEPRAEGPGPRVGCLEPRASGLGLGFGGLEPGASV